MIIKYAKIAIFLVLLDIVLWVQILLNALNVQVRHNF